ncbi:MAG: hypothetical protein OEM98_16350, partial [Gammaproteobacteria bacterium]|nr:hypothetical protein [Gammaproteobacteria bacterium]
YMGRRPAIYHIDHDAGSGYTPEAADKLFARLEAKGIPCLDWMRDVMPIIREMEVTRRKGAVPMYNAENWGYGDIDLPDQIIRPAGGGRPGRAVSDLPDASAATDQELAAKSL